MSASLPMARFISATVWTAEVIARYACRVLCGIESWFGFRGLDRQRLRNS